MDAIRLVEGLGAVKALKKRFSEGKATHAYIIEGEPSLCAKAMTLLASYAICGQGCCGHCVDCINVLKGFHVDCYVFPQEKDKITVDDVRTLVYESNIAPQVSNSKVFILNVFEQSLSNDWQHKLLVTLEEPPKNVYIFIGTDNADKLLDTVRSRCERVVLDSIPQEEVAKYLCSQGYSAESAENAAILSEGNVFKAEQAINDSDTDAIANAVFDLFLTLDNSAQAVSHVAALSVFENKMRQVFTYMQTVMNQAYRKSVTGETVLTTRAERLDAIAARYSPEAMLRSVGLTDAAYSAINSGVNAASTLDNLIMKILEVKYKCRI